MRARKLKECPNCKEQEGWFCRIEVGLMVTEADGREWQVPSYCHYKCAACMHEWKEEIVDSGKASEEDIRELYDSVSFDEIMDSLEDEMLNHPDEKCRRFARSFLKGNWWF